jgi:TonB family protein
MPLRRDVSGPGEARMKRCVLAMVLAAAFGSAVANAQTPLDMADPALTRKPRVDMESSVLPAYPLDAQRQQQEAEVKIRACVDASGKAYDAEFVEPSGYLSLDKATRDWVTTGAVFTPGEAGGKPVAVCNYILTWVWKLPEPRTAYVHGDYPHVSELPEIDRPTVKRQPPDLNYPPGALAAKSEGAVRARVCVDATGKPGKMRLLTPNLRSDLIWPAMSWFDSVTFEPAKKNGEPTGACGVELKYDWKLPSP